MIRVKTQPGEKKKAVPKREAVSGAKAKAKARTGKAAKPSGTTETSTRESVPPKAKGKGGNPPAFTAKDIPLVIEHLRAAGGIKTIAAQRLKIGRSTLYRFIEAHPEIVEEITEIEASILDVAEAQVVKALNAGDMPTVRWFLETKGKDLGYTRRVENTGKGGGPMEVQQKADLADYTDEEVAIMAAAARRRKESQASNQG